MEQEIEKLGFSNFLLATHALHSIGYKRFEKEMGHKKKIHSLPPLGNTAKGKEAGKNFGREVWL